MPRVSGSAWPWLLADDSDAIVGVRSGNIDQLFVFSNDDANNIDLSNLSATWNTSGTTFTAVKMNVTDTASAAASMLIDLQVGGTSQFHVLKSGAQHLKRSIYNISSANVPIVTVSNYSLTGSNADSLMDLAGTWNTTGTPTALKLNVTDTASDASSLLMDLQVGGASKFAVSKTGNVILPNGQGIDFSATTGTGTSELFDDYEEGTFTATLTSATPPTTPITVIGFYTKIGDIVIVIVAFRNVDNTGAAGAISVTGLPFAANAAVYSNGSVWLSRATITNGLVSYITPSSTTMTIVDFNGNSVSWASNGGGIYSGFQITYKA